MKNHQFTQIFLQQVSLCEDVLVVKAKEYATADRLHNFRVAAALEGTTPKQALSGMMAKHTVSIYDMINSDEKFPTEVWTEKITDHINYLMLLKAFVVEEYEDPNQTELGTYLPSSENY